MSRCVVRCINYQMRLTSAFAHWPSWNNSRGQLHQSFTICFELLAIVRRSLLHQRSCRFLESFKLWLSSLISQAPRTVMPKSWACNDRGCGYDDYPDYYPLDLDSLDEVIEHLRSKHKLSYFIQRPHGVGVPDNHGHVWYCFHVRCKTRRGKEHRSFPSDKAMWAHLNDCHSDEVDKIITV